MDGEQRARIATGPGFLAALDQSGGSTPAALELYGVPASDWSGEAAMFDLTHAFRSRIMTAPSFGGGHVLAASIAASAT